MALLPSLLRFTQKEQAESYTWQQTRGIYDHWILNIGFKNNHNPHLITIERPLRLIQRSFYCPDRIIYIFLHPAPPRPSCSLLEKCSRIRSHPALNKWPTHYLASTKRNTPPPPSIPFTAHIHEHANALMLHA